MKTIDTLVEDILGLFDNGHITGFDDPDFGGLVARRLAEHQQERGRGLRMSSLGKPFRQQWYEANGPLADREQIGATTKVKFLFGDILEAMLLHLCKEAGHLVTDEQKEVELDGVPGHIDGIVDGVLVDVKSAASHSFDRFVAGHEAVISDIFLKQYIGQLSGYSVALGGLDACFLVIDKQLGKLCLTKFSKEFLAEYDARKRIADVKQVVAQPEPPERCYADKEFGKSGNRSLATGCSYCPWKKVCWADANNGKGLRTFIYSTGPVHFTEVTNQPKVFEITPKNKEEEKING